jgi:hypothetical protein
VPSYEEDRKWADKFIPHQAQIAEKAIRVQVAPIEDDLRRNTDLVLRSIVKGKRLEEIRISARVRRHDYITRFRDQFTVRLDRPSGIESEMPKIRHGYGDFFIYGFEAEPDADKMHPWLIGNVSILRKYLSDGGYFKIHDNKDGSSRLAVFHIADMPIGFVLDSEGLTIWDNDRIWEDCRNCWWGRSKGGYVAPTPHVPISAHVVPSGTSPPDMGDGYGRYCLACRFWWQSGWFMRATQESNTAQIA